MVMIAISAAAKNPLAKMSATIPTIAYQGISTSAMAPEPHTRVYDTRTPDGMTRRAPHSLKKRLTSRSPASYSELYFLRKSRLTHSGLGRGLEGNFSRHQGVFPPSSSPIDSVKERNH